MKKNKASLIQFIAWGKKMMNDYPPNKLSFYEAIEMAKKFAKTETKVKNETHENKGQVVN